MDVILRHFTTSLLSISAALAIFLVIFFFSGFSREIIDYEINRFAPPGSSHCPGEEYSFQVDYTFTEPTVIDTVIAWVDIKTGRPISDTITVLPPSNRPFPQDYETNVTITVPALDPGTYFRTSSSTPRNRDAEIGWLFIGPFHISPTCSKVDFSIP